MPWRLPPPRDPATTAAARLDRVLEKASLEGRPLLGGCLPAGWPPGLARAAGAWRALAASADLLEAALPAENPYLDGPAIRAAHRETLQAGWHLDDTLGLVARLSSERPVLVMAYWATIESCGGPAGMARDLAAAGAAAAVLPDLPAASAGMWSHAAYAFGLRTVLMTAPDGHLPTWAASAVTGAVYLPAVPGPTGDHAGIEPGLPRRVHRARDLSGQPVITGIGITTPACAAEAARARPAAIMAGTVFTRAVAEAADPGQAVARHAAAFRNAIETGQTAENRICPPAGSALYGATGSRNAPAPR